MYVVDINGFQLNEEARFYNAIDTLEILVKELKEFNPELLHRPSMLLLNKVEDMGYFSDKTVNDSVLANIKLDRILNDKKLKKIIRGNVIVIVMVIVGLWLIQNC